MSKSNESKRSLWHSPGGEVLIFLGACGIFAGEFSLVAGTGPYHASVVVEGNAPVPATEHRLGETSPVTLKPGEAMIAQCRLPDAGLVDVKEDRIPMRGEILPEYTLSPEHLRSALNPPKPNAEWVGSLAICGQE